jgi:hypothetical protein
MSTGAGHVGWGSGIERERERERQAGWWRELDFVVEITLTIFKDNLLLPTQQSLAAEVRLVVLPILSGRSW